MRSRPSDFFFGLRRMLSAILIALVLAAWPAGTARAQASSSGSYGVEAVQAVFLLNFIRFTDWPAEALPDRAPFVVGVAGSRALEDELLSLAEKQTVRDRRIRVIRIKTALDLAGCHVLYINPIPAPGEETAPGAAELLPHVRNQPVLTVSSSPSFLSQGGIVNLRPGENGKLRFDIALEPARANGLVMNSRLLALARIVNPSD